MRLSDETLEAKIFQMISIYENYSSRMKRIHMNECERM